MRIFDHDFRIEKVNGMKMMNFKFPALEEMEERMLSELSTGIDKLEARIGEMEATLMDMQVETDRKLKSLQELVEKLNDDLL